MKLMSIPNGAEEIGVSKQAFYNILKDYKKDGDFIKQSFTITVKKERLKITIIDNVPFVTIKDLSKPTDKPKKK